jgi:hypothetical protein
VPQSTSKKTVRVIGDKISALLEAALDFVPPAQPEALCRKWLDRHHLMAMGGTRRIGAVADALILSADLLRSQPSPSGATAFDRLAKSRAREQAPDAPLLPALRQARFRLLRLEPAGASAERMACDVLSGEALRLPAYDMELLPADGVFFGRILRLADGMNYPAGVITPLDQAALAVARGNGAAGATSVFGNARWAEAVYVHVVRNGTMEIPGLNRPSDDFFDEDDDPGVPLAQEWSALGSAAPDSDLLRRTRESTDLLNIMGALVGATGAREAGDTNSATNYERALMVMLDTVLRRERGASGSLTLDFIADQIDTGVAQGQLPPAVSRLFVSLRQQLVHGAATGDVNGPELAKIMQRIQGLRAKTVRQGCTEQEALAAAEKVAELLDRHGLSLSEVDFKAQPCDGVALQTARRRFAPIDSCIPTIAEFFDCRVWVEQAKGDPIRYVFFGVRADVAASQYLYELVERAFDTETALFQAGEIYASLAGERRGATRSFQVGLGDGICDKLRALQAARDAYRASVSGRDLVVAKAAIVDEEMAKLGLALHKRGISGSRHVLTDAFTAGQEAAERFEYAPAIERAA